jgi:poly-gamma-glutamate synthesis protein (capsule biosynthesis protein)
MGARGRVSVLAVGDVFPDVPDARAAFAPLTELFASADIVFGNCEGVYSDHAAPAPTHKSFCGAPTERGGMLGEVGFDVMTLANNHIVDGGWVGLADTMDLLRRQGIAITGAGPTLADALAPAIVEHDGVSIAFLGFCSVYPKGYEARVDRPGLAPLRVRTHYADPDENFWEPGIEPLIVTEAVAGDLER